MQAITQYLKREGYNTVDDKFYAQVANWQKWYKGKVLGVHNYRQYNGLVKIKRERKSLGMSKKICEDWANLELNEKVKIAIANKEISDRVVACLQANNFTVKGNQLIEIAFALGTGAIVEYLDDTDVKIDYIRAGMIYPLKWDNGEIIDCAFGSERTDGKRKLVYLNIHERLDDGLYTVKNRMFERNGGNLQAVDLPEGVAEEYPTRSAVPMFQIIKPNIVNNIDLDCPMGISVYANALDQLEGLDLIYDSYCNEFKLGKKRIIVPMSMAKIAMQEDGTVSPIFDANDTEFYAVPGGKDASEKIEEINMEIRHESHEAGIKTALNLLSAKCGLGNDRYKFESDGVKTATEVISEKSELFQNLKKHELVLEKALTDMVKALALLSGYATDFEVTINFDDSIIEDTAQEKAQFAQEVRDGIRQKWEYRVKFFGEDEATAKSMVQADEPLKYGDE